MILVLTGAPGAGKGTQADLLADRLSFRKVSTGDALRRHIKSGSRIGKEAEAIMARGELVPDDVLFRILKDELGTNSNDRVLLDGYPRNVSQANTLSSLNDVHPVIGAIHLDVDENELLGRLSGRRVCGSCGASFHVTANPPTKSGVCDRCGGSLIQRPDDEMASVKVRLSVYDKNTKPVLDFYKGRSLYHRVAGLGTTEEVFDRLKRTVEGLMPAGRGQ